MGEPQAAVVSAPRPPKRAAPALHEGLSGLILLGGAIRPTDLSRGLDRPLVDLPIDPGFSVLDFWHREATALSTALDSGVLAARLLVDASGPMARPPAAGAGVRLTVERDRAPFRGTGGVLRDACEGYPPGSFVLVSNANQIMVEPLVDLTLAMAEAGGDIVILAHDDGSPVGLMLVRVAAALTIRGVGFVDFKEQALPALASRFDVRVVRRPAATAVPIRTLGGYLRGLRAYHRVRAGLPAFEGAFAEDWVETFGIVEAGAEVAPGARVHDSVVLKGAVVGAGAVLVRSVVCAGQVVNPGQVVADAVVSERADGGRAG